MLNNKLTFFLDPKKRKAPKPSLMNYRQNKTGLYLMARKRIIEWTDIHSYCHTCLSYLAFNEEYDACYCAECNEWREEVCADPACEYCSNRPNKPRNLW